MVLTPYLAVPFVQKRSADGNPSRKKARITTGDLVSGERPGNPVLQPGWGDLALYDAARTAAGGGGRTAHKDVGGAVHGRQTLIEARGGRAVFARIPPGWAGLGTRHGLNFEEVQGGCSHGPAGCGQWAPPDVNPGKKPEEKDQ